MRNSSSDSLLLLVIVASSTTTTTAGACAYASQNAEHSMCKPKGSCNPHKDSLTDQEKIDILKDHNDFRLKVALGQETRGDPGPQPAGSDIRELVWNDELASIAQAWANTCPNGHDCNDCRKELNQTRHIGQNIYYEWSFNASQQWEKGITAWYDEVADMPNTLVGSFASPTNGKVIGHYTQVVWGATREIGCGAIHYACSLSTTDFPQCKTYVCNYGIGGNFLGSPVYTQGTAATACTSGTSTTYVGLCL